jgi:predicted regulator of Ras-like GTPase activity (Roadblock/LC7/MglB family)
VSFLSNLLNRQPAPASSAVVAARAAPAEIPGPLPSPGADVAPGEFIVFSLKSITDLFPEDLRGAMRKQPSEHVQVQIPKEMLRPQLAGGAVRIRFDELRAAVPEVFFHADKAADDAQVLLPLEPVVREIKSVRRTDQRPAPAPVNIPAVFGRAQPSAGAQEAWYSQRRPVCENIPGITEPANGHAPKPVFVKAAGLYEIPVPAILERLPQEIRHSVNCPDVQMAAFAIPEAEFESRMRAGVFKVTWGALRSWCNLDLGRSAAADTEVRIPLDFMVPVLLAAHRNQEARNQVRVDSRIPDIFTKGRRVAAPAPAKAEVERETQTTAREEIVIPYDGANGTHEVCQAQVEPAPEPAPFEPEAQAAVSNIPSEIIKRLRAVAGVSGAFIATGDGLLVAADLPAANGNVLAAFAPTVFSQLTKYSGMAQLGQPEALDIRLADGVSVYVQKAGRLYAGALFHPGNPVLAVEISRITASLHSS